MNTKILLINGPNLNLLGERDTATYGTQNSAQIFEELKTGFLDVNFELFQSNHEGELIDAIQNARKNFHGILINAGAYSHSSIGMADAIRAIPIPVIGIHISNIYQREEYRHIDVVGAACNGSIVGLGVAGYALATECLLDIIKG